MAKNWYDRIAPLYDLGTSGSSRPRREAVAQLRLEPGDTVLDLACGTGLNFQHVEAGIGQGGLLIGIDFSAGMLARGQRRADRNGWGNVRLIQADARTISADMLQEHAGVDRVDKLLCTLGLSAVPDWETVFERSWELVRPGGRYVIMDWWLERRNLLSRVLEFTSHGDPSRQGWIPLETSSEDYSRSLFIGGRVYVAAGTKGETGGADSAEQAPPG